MLEVVTFAVMVCSVLQAGKSWQVSPGIKDKTLNMCMYSCIMQLLYLRSVEAQGKGKLVWQDVEDTAWWLCKQAKQHDTQWNKLLNWWNSEDVRKCTFFSGWNMAAFWNVKFNLVNNRTERLGYRNLYRLLAINNFESKTASTVDAKFREKQWQLVKTRYNEGMGKSLILCGVSICVILRYWWSHYFLSL